MLALNIFPSFTPYHLFLQTYVFSVKKIETGGKRFAFFSLNKREFTWKLKEQSTSSGLLSQKHMTQLLGSRGDPKTRLGLNDANNDGRRCGFLAENTGVPLVSNSPRSEHGDWCHGFLVRDVVARHIGPPRVDGVVRRPLENVEEGEPEPLLDQLPYAFGEPALEEKVRRRFLSLLAKRTKTTIWTTSPFMAVRGPNPIMDCEPREEFDFSWSPSLPN